MKPVVGLVLVVLVLLPVIVFGASTGVPEPPEPPVPVPPAPRIYGVRVELVDYDVLADEVVLYVVVYRSNPCITIASVDADFDDVRNGYVVRVEAYASGYICIQIVPPPQRYELHAPRPPTLGAYPVYASVSIDSTVYEEKIGTVIVAEQPPFPPTKPYATYSGWLTSFEGILESGWYLYRDNYGRYVALPILVVIKASTAKPYYIAYGILRGGILYAYHYVLTSTIYRVIRPPPPIQPIPIPESEATPNT